MPEALNDTCKIRMGQRKSWVY